MFQTKQAPKHLRGTKQYEALIEDELGQVIAIRSKGSDGCKALKTRVLQAINASYTKPARKREPDTVTGGLMPVEAPAKSNKRKQKDSD